MTTAEFPLPIEPALSPLGHGLTAAAHHRHYGFDLSWVAVFAGRLECAGCGARRQMSSESLVLKACEMQAFIREHVDCVLMTKRQGRGH